MDGWNTSFLWDGLFSGAMLILGSVNLVVLLVVEPTHLKNMLVKLDHLPKDRGE